MKTLLIVQHSMTGGTLQMAEAAARGAGSEDGVRVLCLPARQALPQHVLAADGYLFATPENLASMAGLMKDFFDRCYYAALERIEGRPVASTVATTIELGSGTPASSASSSQRVSCATGSGSASASTRVA